MRKSIIGILFVLFAGLNIFLTFNYHSHSSRHSYHGSLWGDRAGYFVYLPAAFSYGFDASRFPTGMDTLTGGGFTLDRASRVVRTKYTSGVALLQAPFYLVAHGIGMLAGFQEEAFGEIDHIVVTVAAPVLLTLGLYFLFLLLRTGYGDGRSMALLVSLYAGSNLFFYTIGDPGMSHVYSFFLFSAMLLVQERSARQNTPTSGNAILLGGLAGLIILVRPTNAIFLIASLFVGRSTWMDVRLRSIRLLQPRVLVWAVPTALLVWLPQLAYWHYAFNSTITWSYSDEGFTYWNKPHLSQFWFSTNNGLIPYAPLFLVILSGIVILWKRGQRMFAAACAGAILAVSYVGSAWWVWHFGCGLGSRTTVEYYALFSFPLFIWYRALSDRVGRVVPALMILLLIIFQLKITYSYGNCWFNGDWDWEAYSKLVFGPTK